MMKFFLRFIVLFLFVLIMIGCKNIENKSEKKTKEIMGLINNEDNAKDIIKKKIVVSTQSDLLLYGKTLSEVNDKYEIECLRKVDDIYYAIFNTIDDCTLYLLFSNDHGFDEHADDYVVVSYLFLKEPCYSYSFSSLVVNESSIDDVKKIDPLAQYIIGTGRTDFNDCSFHYTMDGFAITIKYNESQLVESIEKTVDNHSVICYLLDIDKPINHN